MPTGNTTNLRSHLSCKNRENVRLNDWQKMSNVSATLQNKYNLAQLKFNRHHSNMVRVSRISRVRVKVSLSILKLIQ